MSGTGGPFGAWVGRGAAPTVFPGIAPGWDGAEPVALGEGRGLNRTVA